MLLDVTMDSLIYQHREAIVARETQHIRDLMRTFPKEEEMARKNLPRPRPTPKIEIPAVLHPEEPSPNAPKTHHALALVDRELIAAVERANADTKPDNGQA